MLVDFEQFFPRRGNTAEAWKVQQQWQLFDRCFCRRLARQATHMGWQVVSAEHPLKMSGLDVSSRAAVSEPLDRFLRISKKQVRAALSKVIRSLRSEF